MVDECFGVGGWDEPHGGKVLLNARLFEASFDEILRGPDKDAGTSAHSRAQRAEVATGLRREKEDDLLGLLRAAW